LEDDLLPARAWKIVQFAGRLRDMCPHATVLHKMHLHIGREVLVDMIWSR